MTFMDATPKATNNMPGMGNENAKIMILGDCPDVYAMKAHKPFAGPRETVLEGCLHQAGLTKGEVYITNFITDDTSLSKYWGGQTNRKKIKANIDGYRRLLWAEIDKVQPKVIVTLDELPTFILTGKQTLAGKNAVRGYPYIYDQWENHPVPQERPIIIIPSFHPGKMIWANYIWRYYLSHDLTKARELSKNPELLGQPQIETIIPSTFIEAKQYLNYCSNFDCLSVDIEVDNFEVSCIGFATSPTKAFSIPTDMRWSIEEEVAIWNMIANILADKRITKIGQNFIFDIHFLAYKMGIMTYGKIIDTMMGHSILYPDFLKGLGFLGSIYTKQPMWKDAVSFKDIKKES